MKISISAQAPTKNFEAIRLVREVTGCSLSSAKEKLMIGKAGFFYTTELFLNDHRERDPEIRKLLIGFNDLGIALFIAEINNEQKWINVEPEKLEKSSISEELLLNILNEAKGRYR